MRTGVVLSERNCIGRQLSEVVSTSAYSAPPQPTAGKGITCNWQKVRVQSKRFHHRASSGMRRRPIVPRLVFAGSTPLRPRTWQPGEVPVRRIRQESMNEWHVLQHHQSYLHEKYVRWSLRSLKSYNSLRDDRLTSSPEQQPLPFPVHGGHVRRLVFRLRPGPRLGLRRLSLCLQFCDRAF